MGETRYWREVCSRGEEWSHCQVCAQCSHTASGTPLHSIAGVCDGGREEMEKEREGSKGEWECRESEGSECNSQIK